MVSTAMGALALLAMVAVALTLPVAIVWLLIKGFQGLYWLLALVFRGIGALVLHVYTFVRNTFADALGFVGGVLTAVLLVPLALFNVLFGRWSASGHYLRAFGDEVTASALSLYRVVLGNPIRLFGLRALTDGLERRLPDVVARAPGSDRPRTAKKTFEGYRVVGSLASGGSGSRLYLAEPTEEKAAALRAAGLGSGKVVIKSFDQRDGSTLSQIVRESRALEAARGLGLVLDHELTGEGFWYAMPYVPGVDLATITRRLHDRAGTEGLENEQLALVCGYACDLLATLERFHSAGLWHKDIKPTNIIVSGGRAHLVDLGLVTPIASAMTLTTHGTEYFRDPEMVRLAMNGAKVQDVDGVKFDLYSAGAVLYSMIENSFPAHGSLSKVTRRCPEALGWIVRRAMADLDNRYTTATEMLADLRTLLAARDPFKLRPIDLPSVRGVVPEPPAFQPPRRRPVALAHVAAASTSAPTTDRGRCRKRRSRMVGALGVCALLYGSAFGLFHGMRAGHRPRVHVGYAYDSSGHPAFWERLGEALETTEHGDSAYTANDDCKWFDDDPAERACSVVAERNGLSGNVLILNDAPALDPSRFSKLVSVVEEENFRALGAGHVPELEDREIELTAGARRAVGLATPEDPEADARLRRFLTENDDLDAILWLVPGHAKDRVQVYLLAQNHVRPAALESWELPAQPGE